MHRFLEGLCIIRLDLSGVIQAQMLEYSKFRVHSTWKAKIGLFPSTNSLVMPVERNERKRKPREGHAPYKPRKPKQPTVKNPPKTSAQPSKSRTRSNLTLNDWLTVIAYVDKHPDLSQDAIVKHFSTRVEGILIFDQSTLSRKLKSRNVLEERAKSHPNALSLRRDRIVTRPDVDKALFQFLWVKHMEEKGESVNGAMLIAKRARFEEQFNVPHEERLESDGWLGPFKKAYNIKEYRRHGEAGSVDIAAVAVERTRVQTVLANYAPKNQFNFDETSFFALFVICFLCLDD